MIAAVLRRPDPTHRNARSIGTVLSSLAKDGVFLRDMKDLTADEKKGLNEMKDETNFWFKIRNVSKSLIHQR